ncbi:MAG: molybdopterin molybdenumtransferase MoeA, partial [Pseudohongiellaceae bacterium]
MPASLIPVDQALARILVHAPVMKGTQERSLHDALGGVLARAQTALIDVHAYHNSAMDGFAVNLADLAGE